VRHHRRIAATQQKRFISKKEILSEIIYLTERCSQSNSEETEEKKMDFSAADLTKKHSPHYP
jgi:hypothetical protein